MEVYFLLFILFTNTVCVVYRQQPRIVSSNGNIIIKAVMNKNIIFYTTGSGKVNLNGVDLTQTIQMAKNTSQFIERYQASFQDSISKFSKIERLIEGNVGIIQRLTLLENDVRNSSFSPIIPHRTPQMTRLNRRLNNLERRFNALMNLLSKDECLNNPCKNGATCQDLFSSFMCICPPEWDGPLCDKDVNECAIFAGTDLGCQNGATCVNKPGTYECLCQQGYVGIHCMKKSNDCNSGSNVELCGHGTCISVNDRIGYKCLCDQGWKTDGVNPACNTDVDECKMGKPPCSVNPAVTCINLPGSFHCGGCPPGYTGNGFYCADIDECAVNNGGCSTNPLVQCVNEMGSFHCGLCPPGYIGDGKSCSYHGICAVNNGGCHQLAQCRDNPGVSSTFVQCICPAGYTGNGIGPSGCLQITTGGSNPCSSNPCVNGVCAVNTTTGEYYCNCFSKYTGRNCNIRKNLCDPNPCRNGGTCHPLLVSFRCICTASYTGFLCSQERQACGGKLQDDEGTIKYPEMESANYDHHISCAWVIETTDISKVLIITFTKFNLESSRDCHFDWLQIHDGRNSAAHNLGRFCGNALPNGGVIISTHNVMYLWFRSDHSVSKTGFELSWKSIPPVCGFVANVTTHGTIRSPGSPGNYPPNRDCYWVLNVTPGKRLLFHFFSLIIGNNNDCNKDYLEFFDNSINTKPFAKYCNSSQPEPLYSPGPTTHIHFHSSNTTKSYPGFQLTYSVIEALPGCGGVYTAESGEIKSPTVDGAYPPDLTCEYKIKLIPESKIKVTFLTFDLEDSTSCQFDYVALYEGTTFESPLVGKYCGSIIPAAYISSSNELLIVFKTDWATSHLGFTAKYESLCGGVYTQPSGIIQSPGYPEQYFPNKVCIYEIVQPLGKSIIFSIISFDIEKNSHPECVYDYLEIRDGDNENSTLVGRYCHEPPPNVMSTHNYLWLQFHTDSSVTGIGFQANYSTIDIGCGGILKSTIGTISSPQYPDLYPSGKACRWVIIAPPRNVIQLTWMNFNVEQSFNCAYDYVAVYDNHTLANMGGLIGTYCGTTLPPTLLTSSNVMTIIFFSDTTVSSNGFLATYTFQSEQNVCNANYYTSAGVIKSPQFPANYPVNSECTWTITVQPGQQILLNVTHFDVELFSACRYDYLEIHNGGTAASPLIGKYCGTKIPKLIPSHSNKMYIVFKSDMTKTASGFQIYWESTATGCGGTLTSPAGLLISPHYPESYSRNADCFWKISVSAGSQIQVIFADMDLEPHAKCMLDYIELFDGPSTTSPSLGKFCKSHPPFIRSTGNHLSVKFRSDISYQGRGFQLQYNTVCNNSMSGFRGVIESPNFPDGYPHDQNCKWTIEVPMGNKINISFSHFELESSELTAGNCSYDYVEIKYLNKAEINSDEGEEFVSYGKYCGDKVPDLVTLNSEKAIIIFVTDNFLLGNGFRLEWQVEGCGGLLTHPLGTISTPNYPKGYPMSTECIWVIKVDVGQSVKIQFTDVSIEKEESCDYDYVQVLDGPDKSSPEIIKFCSHINKVVLTSSGNSMYIKFASDYSYRGRGFIANYTTVTSKCGGEFSAPSGTIHSSNYPKNYDRNDSCDWLIEVAEHHSIELTFDDFDLPDNCNYNFVKIYDGPSQSDPLLRKLCGRQLHNDTIKSTNNKIFVVFHSRGLITSKGFAARYWTSCGARIVTNSTGLLHFSERTVIPESNCTWTIISADPSKHVFLTLNYLFMTSYCEEDYFPLQIYNGENENSPLLGQYCGNKIPPMLVSDGNALFIKTEDTTISVYATYSIFDSHCGGILPSESGLFSTPNYPRGYPVDTQCEWTLKVAEGNSVTLSFTDFELVSSDECNFDYLEIRENNSMGKILGVFCGNNAPSNITSKGSIWLLFKSGKGSESGGITAKGFLGEYALVHGNELFGPSGKIASPLYPEFYKNYETFTWRITVTFGWQVTITFLDFYLEDYLDSDCYSISMEIFDGYDDTAPLIGTYCGLVPPESVKTTSNIAFIKANYHSPTNSRFFLKWNQVEKSKPSTSINIKTDGCGFDSVKDISDLRNYTLTSPGYPYGYAPLLNCEWIFSTVPENHLSISFIDVNLESSLGNCLMDKVSVYSGVLGKDEWVLQANYCSQSDDYNHHIHTGNVMKVVFKTDVYANETGFSANIYNQCGGSVTAPGYIMIQNMSLLFTNYRAQIDCQWNVTAKPGRTIEVTFEQFDLPKTSNKECESYIMLRNGLFPHSPLLGQGKYCQNNFTGAIKTTANYLSIKYHGPFVIKGIKVNFREISITCGNSITLTKLDNKTEITSPNYPNIASPHSECSWVIMAPPGEILKIDFKQRFDLVTSNGCTKEAVEIRDGGTKYSPLIGRFCDNMPSTQYTTDNMAFITYITDIDEPHNGFKAAISLGSCGGTVTGRRGYVKSPNFNMKNMYLRNADCTWHIRGPENHYLILKFNKLDLEKTKSNNCTNVDRVNITELLTFNGTYKFENPIENNLGLFCGNIIPSEIVTSSNEVLVHFKTDDRPKQLDGFNLTFEVSQKKCGGIIETDSGEIVTPGYPTMTPNNRRCTWTIRVQKGRRITLEVLDFDLDTFGQGLVVYSDDQYMSRVALMKSNSQVRLLRTSENIATLYYWSTHMSYHRGFKIKYSSNEPTICTGDFNANEGKITYPKNVTDYSCTWEFKKNQALNGTLVLKILTHFSTKRTSSFSCKYSSTTLIVTKEKVHSPIVALCENLTIPHVIRSPYPLTKLLVRQNANQVNLMTFQVSYKKYSCGGIVTSSGYITSPGYPALQNEESECGWLIRAQEGEAIKLKFNELDVGTDCAKSFVAVYNGEDVTSPRIAKLCSVNQLPYEVISQTNKLFVEFHRDLRSGTKGFNFTHEVVTTGCGGIFYDDKRSIETPSYPNDYPNNAECVWELHAKTGYHIGLTFVGRFFIEKSSHCANDFLEVFDWVNNNWQSIKKLCGREVPRSINSTGNKMKLLFRSNEKIYAPGFKAMWNLNCGGKFEADNKMRYIVSPGYPLEYQNELICTYEIFSSQTFHLSFEDFETEKGPRSNCKFDNVTVSISYPFNWYMSNNEKVYCGQNAPPDVYAKAINITLRTDKWIRKRGFKFVYGTDSCGGIINQPTKIQSPKSVTQVHHYSFHNVINCYWNITAPKDQTIVVRFENFILDHGRECYFSFVEAFEGLEPNETVRLMKLCGNLTSDLPTIKSTTDKMIVHLKSEFGSSKGGIQAMVYFTHGKQICYLTYLQ